MIAISLRFPAGRYHTTPWGRHVNEGAVEWPPSPWRFLRALVAVWKRTMADETQERVEPIIRALASPPSFALPPASTGHTRHYMPWNKGWSASEPGRSKTKVFDAFVALDPHAPLVACWPDVELDPSQRQLLGELLANLNFLGRAESWCQARLLCEPEAKTCAGSSNCAALDEGESAAPNEELVRTLCPDPDTAFADDHVVEVETTSQGRGKSRTTTQVRRAVYEPNWHLCMETLRLHDQKWSDPPGSRWISYARPRGCFDIRGALGQARTAISRRPQVVRFALDSAVLPLVTDTLPVAEAARRALIRMLVEARGLDQYAEAWSRKLHTDGAQPVPLDGVITGKDDAGKPSVGHAHAYYLPTDEDGDGRIDHITVVARAGFRDCEMKALGRLRSIWLRERDRTPSPLRALLLGAGQLGEYPPPPVGSATVWISATPYIATQYAKTRGTSRIDIASPQARIEFLLADLRSQLRTVSPTLAEDAEGAEISPVHDGQGFHVGGRWRTIQFVRSRSKSGDDGSRRLAGSFRITFKRRVPGPIALGYGGHFGMGLFLPEAVG